jgi:hypothetical protein
MKKQMFQGGLADFIQLNASKKTAEMAATNAIGADVVTALLHCESVHLPTDLHALDNVDGMPSVMPLNVGHGDAATCEQAMALSVHVHEAAVHLFH